MPANPDENFQVCPRSGKTLKPKNRHRWIGWLFPVTGLFSLIWFLVRVLPKPTRATYPCQRVAAPLASGFIVWLLGLAGSALAFHKAKRCLYQSRYVLSALCIAIAVAAIWLPLGITGQAAKSAPTDPTAPPFDPNDLNMPVGIARGINPGRVVWVYDEDATNWDGVSDHWWHDVNTDPVVVDDMMAKGIRWLTDQQNNPDAWDAIFRNFNQTHGYGDIGYQPGEKIAIKINLIQSYGYSWEGNNLVNPSPQMVHALLKQLIERAGVDESAITIYDAILYVGDPIYDRCHASFPGVNFVDHDGGNGRLAVQHTSDVRLFYGDPSIVPDSGLTTFPDCVVEAKYFINMALLKPHVLGGMTLCAKNMFGSVWHPNYDRFEGWDPGHMHRGIAAFDWSEPGYQEWPGRPMGSYNPLVDLMGHEDLGGKTLLYLIEALYTTPVHQGGEPVKWLSAPFNDDWTSSLFVSQDGVAIDSVGLDFLRSEINTSDNIRGTLDNYLHEAAMANAPTSGTFYDPEDDGTRLASLGVHEHWNNPTNRQYTRNLGTGAGIELISSLSKPVPYSTRNIIGDNFVGSHSVYATDLDGDGDLDVLGAAVEDDAITWWENIHGDAQTWSKHVIDDTFDGSVTVYAADVDGDNDIDVLGAAHLDDEITWWENVNSDGSVWSKHIVDSTFDRAGYVYAADVW